MKVFECNFGEGLKLLSEDGEVCLVLLRDKNNNNSRIKIGIKTSENIDVHIKEKYQRIHADLQQQVESYYYSTISQKNSSFCENKIIRPTKVLLVEDTEIIRKVNANFLESLGCNVFAAKNGREAFDLLQNKFDLILLDIGLPDISGIEICKFIRAHSINQSTPVIFLTAFGKQIKNKCIAAGCDDFEIKPLSIEKLQKLISKWLHKNNNTENKYAYRS